MTAEQFKAARIAKSMTQKELAAFLGDASYSAVTKWETGANPIPKWVEEKLVVPSTLKLSDLSAEELALFEKRAAERGRTPESIYAELVRNFLRLSIL